MIFSDKFELNDFLQACILFGASLSVNGIDQGTITAVNAELADQYTLRVGDTGWLQVLGWQCGVDSNGPFVRLGTSIDFLIPPIDGETQSEVWLQTTAPTDICGNAKMIYCP